VANISGDGIYNSAISSIHNCILWGDSPQVYNSGTLTITYSNIQGGWNGEGNIDIDPNFVDPANSDYHLKSQAGRWNPNTLTWIQDAVTSPCVDAGDPTSVWTNELWPHGKRINMGAYGGTPQASMSRSCVGNIADLNHDDVVDFLDYNIFSNGWPVEQVLLASDLSRNGSMGIEDMEIFCDNWLWSAPAGQLVGHWKFDETSGSTAEDSSGNGNNGTLVNGPVWTGNGALSFDGMDDYVEFPDSNTLKFDKNLSISVWIYLNDYADFLPNNFPKIVIKPYTSFEDPWELFCIDLGHYGTYPRFIVTEGVPGGNHGVANDINFTLSLHKWYHIVGIYDGQNISLYVDGNLIDTQPLNISIGNNTMPLSIGGRLGRNTFDGLIDEVQIYNRALTICEIMYLYNK